jgi:hypothetical protein
VCLSVHFYILQSAQQSVVKIVADVNVDLCISLVIVHLSIYTTQSNMCYNLLVIYSQY